MAQPSFLQDLKYEIERLKAEVHELHRKRDRRPPNFGDLQNVNGWGAATGHAMMYDQTTGRYRPVLAPPTLRFNKNGTLDSSSSDLDPMGGPGKLIKLKARLTTAGSSSSTVVLYHMGSTVVASWTFAAGRLTPNAEASVAFTYAEDDVFSVATPTRGANAGGLVVAGWAIAPSGTGSVVIEGGNASGSGVTSYDGGSASTTFTSTLDGGSA